MDRVQYNISGVENVLKKTAIQNALNKVDGVGMVNIDMVKSHIEVGFSDPATEQQIQQAIERTGTHIL